MNRQVAFLDPAHKLVDGVVGWLCRNRIEQIEGATSLAHVLVIVPTAQSGRNLRLALAEEAARRGWGGLLPPKIAMPSALLVPAGVRVATEAEELAALASVLAEGDVRSYGALFPQPPAELTDEWALGMAETILGLEKILGERALLMSEVKPAGDLERWQNLAAIERTFFDCLERQGVVPRLLARRRAVGAGCREEGIREIVLPSPVDLTGAMADYLAASPQTVAILVHADASEANLFDDWGRPTALSAAALAADAILALPTATREADEIARYFRAVGADEALPALAVCDAEMYPELEGAFQNHFREDELVLRNPAREKLAHSALGRLLGAIVSLSAEPDYETFSTLVRMGDVARWAREALGATAAEIATFVGALDAVQNAHLPRTMDEAIAGARLEAEAAWHEDERTAASGLVRLGTAVKAELGDPFAFLRKIFGSVTLDEKRSGDRELVAASEVVRDLREACQSPVVPPRFRRRLFARLLKGATYMLEPTAGNVLATTGWLEVAWCPDAEIVFAGLNEGCVPENVVGHPFVPDSLRAELGLTTNAGRERRDAFLLAEAVRCRAKGAVRVYLHQVAGDKSVMKPSRILFNGISDRDLPALARRLYAVTKGNEGAPAKELPPAWRLKLPFPPKGIAYRERISPTALDQYLRCPFNFHLQETFGEHADDRSQELDNLAFGNLCHAALEQFAKTGPKDSAEADEIAAFLAEEVRRQLRAFGPNLPAIVELQGEAAIARLKAFAPLQAIRRRAGWRIIAAEQNLACRIKGCPTLLSGKVDRIDAHEGTGELAVIDYKTWNRADDTKRDSIQLPVYRAMVEASGKYDTAAAHRAKAFYCVLAERPEDVLFDEEHAYHEGLQSAAEDRIGALLTAIAKGIFYPPNRDGVWRPNYGALLGDDPESSLDPAWLADQKARLETARKETAR